MVPMATTEYADGVVYEWWCVNENEDKATRLCGEDMVYIPSVQVIEVVLHCLDTLSFSHSQLQPEIHVFS